MISSRKLIEATFDRLPKNYQEKILYLSDVTKTDLKSLYFDILRKAIERKEEGKDSKLRSGRIRSRLPILLPVPYFVPENLWQALKHHTRPVSRFAKFRREYIKQEIESLFYHHALKGVSSKQIKSMGRTIVRTGARILPVPFPEDPHPIAPRKYFLKHFRYVDRLLNKHGVEAALDLGFIHFFEGKNGYSRESFAKAWRSWVRGGRKTK